MSTSDIMQSRAGRRAGVSFALFAGFVLTALAPSNERAIFQLDPAPTALAAIAEGAPPTSATVRFFDVPPAVLRRIFQRPATAAGLVPPRLGAQPGSPGTRGPVFALPGAPDATVQDFVDNAVAGSAGQDVFDGVGGGDNLAGGPAFSPAALTPAVVVGVPETPIAFVPEPATWLLMLSGFFAIATILRMARRNARAAATDNR